MVDLDNLIAAIQELQASQQMVMANIKATRAGQEKTKTNQEEIKSLMDMNQEVMEAIQGKIRRQPTEDGRRSRQDGGQKEMMATVRSSQGKRGAATSSIRSELEEAMKNWVGDFLSSVNQWTWDTREKLKAKIKETQLCLQAVTKDLHKELNLRILETWIDIQAMKTLDKTM